LCESGAPSWKFSADQMDLTLDGAGTIRNGYFYVMDVPVFYLPYAYLPLNTDRQTGFLFPKFGHSTKDGFRYLQPFYWAASKSTDATVAFDVETKARLGLLGELRTILDRESDFRINGSYFNELWRTDQNSAVVDRTIADQTIPQNRWSVVGSHRWATSSDWLTFSDFAAYSDDLFTRELADRFDLTGIQEANVQRSRYDASRFGVFKNWGDAFLKGEWSFYQDFIQYDKYTLHRTPQIAFWGRRLLADFPLEFRWRAEAINYYSRESGEALRLDLRPELVMPFRLPPHFYGSMSVAPRETVYHKYAPVIYIPVKTSDRNVSRELVELRGNVGTSFSRVFGFESFGISRVKHVIEPEISYLFVPGVNQGNIPIMDDVDRINRRNVFTFAVTNRLWGKTSTGLAPPSRDSNVEMLSSGLIGDVREMASLRLAMGYDINQARKGADSLTDIDSNLRLTPLSYIDIAFDGGINPGAWHVTQARLAFNVTDPRPVRRTLDPDFNRPNTFGFAYQYVRKGPNSYLADDANVNLDLPPNCVAQPLDPRCPGTGFNGNTVGNLNTNVLYHAHDNVLLNFTSTYDVLDSRFIGFRATTKLLSFCECWTLTFAVSHNVNPDKTSFGFDFSLLGLGNTKSSLNR
jgi:LPS-assembly protein